MSVRLRFRQGAFLRDLECQSVKQAIARAGAFTSIRRYSEFLVTNEIGVALLTDCEVRAACDRLRDERGRTARIVDIGGDATLPR